MALEFKLPDVGEGIAEGEIVKWHVQPGDAVQEHQTVVEVMTDKAVVEIPAPKTGTITELRAKEGDVVPVGDVIFILDTGAEAPASAPEAPAADAPASADSHLLDFKLPDIGEGIAEGEIVSWAVKEGDTVAEHQTVLEVMTDKAMVEIPSPKAGTIHKILVPAGETVPIGTVVFQLQVAGAGAAGAKPAAKTESSAPAATAPSASAAKAPRASGERVLAVPSARRVARELNVDLAQVSGSGRNGVIRRADVEAFAAGGGQAAASSGAAAPSQSAREPVSVAASGERVTRKPFAGIRRKVAEQMVRSKFTATHFTVVEEVDVTELVNFVPRAKAFGKQSEIKVTYTPFLMKACASALMAYPELNSMLDESSNEIVTHHYVNLGIATDTPAGLVVPVFRDVQAKGILQLSDELNAMAVKARDGKIKPDDLQGGTFTLSNAGQVGSIHATPIINFPEVGILGAHRIVKRPGVVETPEGDKIEVRHYMNLSISVDHRLADGMAAVKMLVHMKQLLEDPGLLAL